MSITVLEEQIRAAFASVPPPPVWSLADSREGDEPLLLERDFCDKADWRLLTPEFLDSAPDGFASALSFFSDEAFRFYLPAYILADLRGQLQRVDVLFHLTHGSTTSPGTSSSTRCATAAARILTRHAIGSRSSMRHNQ